MEHAFPNWAGAAAFSPLELFFLELLLARKYDIIRHAFYLPPDRVNKYGLLTKREVKMAEYWQSSFLLRVYKPRRSGFRGIFSRDTAGSPLHLTREANYSTRFGLSCKTYNKSFSLYCLVIQNNGRTGLVVLRIFRYKLVLSLNLLFN